jgi:hypothetical protein
LCDGAKSYSDVLDFPELVVESEVSLMKELIHRLNFARGEQARPQNEHVKADFGTPDQVRRSSCETSFYNLPTGAVQF